MNLKNDLILLDASVLLAAWGSNQGASWAILQLNQIGVLQTIVTPKILAEAKKNQNKVPHPQVRDIESLIGQFKLTLLKNADTTTEDRWRGKIAEKDLHVLVAAIQHQVNYLLTYDVKDFSDPRLGKLPFEVWLPEDFVRWLRETGKISL